MDAPCAQDLTHSVFYQVFPFERTRCAFVVQCRELLLLLKLLLFLPQQQVGRRTLLACPLDVSQFVMGILWVLFDHPFCISRCNIYLEKYNSRWWSSRFGKFKMAAVVRTLMLRQNSRWRVLMLRHNSRWRSSYALLQDGGRVCALGGASICNSGWRAPSLKFNVVTA